MEVDGVLCNVGDAHIGVLLRDGSRLGDHLFFGFGIVQLKVSQIVPHLTIGAGRQSHIGQVASSNVASLHVHHEVASADGLGELHLQIVWFGHFTMPVAVPECLDPSVQQVAQFLAFFFVGSVTGELRHIGYQWVAIRGHWGRWCLGVGTQTGKL